MRSRNYEKGFDDCEDIYKDKVAELKEKIEEHQIYLSDGVKFRVFDKERKVILYDLIKKVFGE